MIQVGNHVSLRLFWFLAAVAPGCTRSPAAEPELPNLVLITLDTLRADHLGCYGYFRDTSPTIDKFAEECLLFERCFAPIALTTPSHLSILTGVYPYEHGVLSNLLEARGEEPLRPFAATDGLQTVTQFLRGLGYRTGGFVSATPLKSITGIAAGFEAWSQPEGHKRSCEAVCEDVFPWLAEQGDEPFFLWAHFYDAHGPYEPGRHPPPPYDALFDEDDGFAQHRAQREFPEEVKELRNADEVTPLEAFHLYDGSIRWLDDQLAPLLDRLRERPDWDRTIVVITSDHGQGLGEHGYFPHGIVWQEQVQVPLLVRVPERAPGRTPALLSTVDILPTLFGLLPGFPHRAFTEQCSGVDVLAAPGSEHRVLAMSPPRRGWEALSDGRWKLIRHVAEEELYDLEADPHERENVIGSRAGEAARLKSVLDALVDEQRARGEVARQQRPATIDGEVADQFLEELEGLGYVGDEEDE